MIGVAESSHSYPRSSFYFTPPVTFPRVFSFLANFVSRIQTSRFDVRRFSVSWKISSCDVRVAPATRLPHIHGYFSACRFSGATYTRTYSYGLANEPNRRVCTIDYLYSRFVPRTIAKDKRKEEKEKEKRKETRKSSVQARKKVSRDDSSSSNLSRRNLISREQEHGR